MRNLRPIHAGGAVNTCYVRPTGDDATATGEIDRPYATLFGDNGALSAILPLIIKGEAWVFDVTGIAEVINDTRVVGPCISMGSQSFMTPSRDEPAIFDGPIRIKATPEVVEADSSFTISGVAAVDGTSASGIMFDITTDLNYALNALKGHFVIDDGGAVLPVVSNTAGPNTVIRVLASAGSVSSSQPMRIAKPGAVISGTGDIYVPGLNQGWNWSFIELSCGLQDDTRNQPGSVYENCYINGGDEQSLEGSVLWGTICKDAAITCNEAAGKMVASGCVFDNTGVYLGGRDMNQFTSCAFIDCNPVGRQRFSTSFGNLGHVETYLKWCWIESADTHGVQVTKGSTMRIDQCDILSSTNDAVNCEGYVEMKTVKGASNGGLGLKLTNGGHGKIESGNVVTGTGGDIKVGAEVATTWGALSLPDADAAELCLAHA